MKSMVSATPFNIHLRFSAPYFSPFPFHLKEVLRETKALLDIIYKVSLLDVWQLHTVTLLLVLTLKEHTDEECNNAK